GISRATLNNYISSGLVPRPEVLPPEPTHGDAPRIGYFPDDTIERIAEIQRLKQAGWSIARIAERFAGQPGTATAVPASPAPVTAAPRSQAGAGTAPALSLEWPAEPVYLLDDSFAIRWVNDAARRDPLLPFRDASVAAGANVFGLLSDWASAGDLPDAVLRFHLALARQRGLPLQEICRGLEQEHVTRLAGLYGTSTPVRGGLLVQSLVSGGPGASPLLLCALQLREGLLFFYMRNGQAAPAVPVTGGQGSQKLRAAQASEGGSVVPMLTPVAILVARLQDASGLWLKLPAQEYFELVNDVWTVIDPVLRRWRGRTVRHPGEAFVCYFLPQQDSSHLANALAAAHQTREAMRAVNRRWQARKGWTVELCLNTGLDEGQEWMGSLRAGEPIEATVLGEAADRASQLSALGRGGSIWITRNFANKVRAAGRGFLKYGVRRLEASGAHGLVPSSFSPLEDLAAATSQGASVPAGMAGLAVTELVDLDLAAPGLAAAGPTAA
ncbi:MAG: hypothetical protein AVDCRST_MAG51-1844, partial [uncultured Ramlibacter sp.]